MHLHNQGNLCMANDILTGKAEKEINFHPA